MSIVGENQKSWAKAIVPIVLSFVLVAGFGFVVGSVRAESAAETKWDEIKPDIQKLRAMPDPSQVVTKDQFGEVVKRLDERTEQISLDVQFLRQRAESRSH
jgi:hypothetical protein